MNLMSLSVIVASLILPVTKTENIKTDFTGKLIRMGYSQEEINAFSKEKSEKFSHLELVESSTTISTIDDNEELIQVGDSKDENLYATESTSDNATVSDGTKTMKTTVSLVRESTLN